jgi:hypothetical protein
LSGFGFRFRVSGFGFRVSGSGMARGMVAEVHLVCGIGRVVDALRNNVALAVEQDHPERCDRCADLKATRAYEKVTRAYGRGHGRFRV